MNITAKLQTIINNSFIKFLPEDDAYELFCITKGVNLTKESNTEYIRKDIEHFVKINLLDKHFLKYFESNKELKIVLTIADDADKID